MFVKAVIISVMSTGMLGASVNVVETKTLNHPNMFLIGVEMSVGPIRIESAGVKGRGFTVYMESHTQMIITFIFKDDHRVKIKL
ncbi:MAG: hypothetical protein COA43_07895 [Robiginitomaculum sp.]|nr:MAG: hypothetical protein COA43_07895 [Robiginitomaculum sp.]